MYYTIKYGNFIILLKITNINFYSFNPAKIKQILRFRLKTDFKEKFQSNKYNPTFGKSDLKLHTIILKCKFLKII